MKYKSVPKLTNITKFWKNISKTNKKHEALEKYFQNLTKIYITQWERKIIAYTNNRVVLA